MTLVPLSLSSFSLSPASLFARSPSACRDLAPVRSHGPRLSVRAGAGAAAARGVGPGVREREAERLGGRKGRGGACAAGAAAATRRARR